MNATPVVAGKPKLLDRVRHALRVRHLARSTEKAYVYWIRRFILHHDKRHPLDMGKQEIEAFLTHLAVHQHVSASTQNQAFSALLFLYRELLKRDFGWLDSAVRKAMREAGIRQSTRPVSRQRKASVVADRWLRSRIIGDPSPLLLLCAVPLVGQPAPDRSAGGLGRLSPLGGRRHLG